MNEPIKYTNHAFDRMAERDITRPMVEAVVRSGKLDRVEVGDIRRYRLENLIVVLDGNDVVTVYFDDDARRTTNTWGRKKKQRKGRKGEMKAHFFNDRGRKINIRQQEYYLRKMEEKQCPQ